MSWTDPNLGPFTATAAGRRNQVRIRVGDVDSNRQLITDEALNHLIDDEGENVLRATVAAAQAILARFSTRPDSQTVGRVTIDWRGVRDRLLAIISQYDQAIAEGADPYAGGISLDDRDEFDDDSDNVLPRFHEDVHRHRLSGEPLQPDLGDVRR